MLASQLINLLKKKVKTNGDCNIEVLNLAGDFEAATQVNTNFVNIDGKTIVVLTIE